MSNKITPSMWAEKNRVLVGSPFGKRWDPERTPELCGVMDALAVSGVEKVVLMASPQTGKTEAMLNVLGWQMEMETTGHKCLVLAPSETEAEALSRERIQPMLNHLLIDPESVHVRGADNLSAIVGIAWRVVLAESIDKFLGWEDERGGSLAMAERKSYMWGPNRKVFLTGSPSAWSSRIGTEFQLADVRFSRTGKCPVCGTEHFMTLRYFDSELMQYECPACHARWDGFMRLKAIAEGGWYDWKYERPLEEALADPNLPCNIVTFRLPAICSSLWTMEDLARWKKKILELREKGDDYEQMMKADLAAMPGGASYA